MTNKALLSRISGQHDRPFLDGNHSSITDTDTEQSESSTKAVTEYYD
jgi:CDGSH-type Zn-finger protein